MLNEEQSRVVEMSRRPGITILTGGPGTGKTHTCREVISAWRGDGIEPSEILLCSPTGKAARRLSESTGMRAQTIHRALGWSADGWNHDKDNPLPDRAVIIDEASMLDVELAAALFSAISPGTRVLVVGDVDQLPSVGPGCVLRDMIASEAMPVVVLHQIYRQSDGSWIAENAARIKSGKQPELPRDAEDFFFHDVDSADDVAILVEQLAVEASRDRVEAQILCPQRTTKCGVAVLNERLQRKLNPKRSGEDEWRLPGRVLRVGDRVMHVVNDYMLGVMNGEVGVVKRFDREDGGGQAMVVDYDDREVAYTREKAIKLQLCYATTIHKSQGSEYDRVIVVCHSANSYMLSRSLLYTAITRGKKTVHVVGDRKGLRRAIRNTDAAKRSTALSSRINQSAAQ